MRVLPVAGCGVLIEIDRPQALSAWVRAQTFAADLREVVPAARTVYLEGPAEAVRRCVEALGASGPDDLPGSADRLGSPGTSGDGVGAIELPVRFDGPDLDPVSTRVGLGPGEVVALLTDVTYVVGFLGFSPGQPFLAGVPDRLRLPRRASPRTRVPPGSLGIAREYATLYPRSSPGGWQLVGRYLGPPLWDSSREPPNRLAVGARVRLVPVAGST